MGMCSGAFWLIGVFGSKGVSGCSSEVPTAVRDCSSAQFHADRWQNLFAPWDLGPMMPSIEKNLIRDMFPSVRYLSFMLITH
jgi:hypothetical protein